MQHKKIKPIGISVVLPCFNEEVNIVSTVNSIHRYLRVNPAVCDYEIIVVNDGSRDKSLANLLRLKSKLGRILRIINHPKNLGYGKSLKDGFNYSKKDWIFFTDSDGQFDIKDLDKFFPHTDKADYIIGKRLNRQDNFLRRLNAKLFKIAIRLFFGIRTRDIDCAFKLFRRNVFDIRDMRTDGAMINAELIYRASSNQARIVEIDVNHYKRKFGSATGGNIKVILKAMREFIMLKAHFLRLDSDPGFYTALIAFLSSGLVITATKWALDHNVILAYGDAEAHLNISKRVVDSLTPGLSQIGGVWLPLPHISMLPLVWNDYLWRTGLAGSIVSGVAFIWSVIYLYKTAFLLTKKPFASLVAPVIFMFNPNALYMATTPMSEILLFSTLVTSIYYFMHWVYYERLFSLIFAAFFVFLATLSRYDGWFLLLAEIAAVIALSWAKGRTRKWIEGKVIIFSALGFLGIFIWLGWNQLIFGNIFYFANSDYGSKAQQMWFYARGYLPTYRNLPLSALYYLTDTYLVLGLVVSVLAVAGLLYFIGMNIGKWVRLKQVESFSALLLLTPFIFYTVSLYTGQASLILPNFSQPWYKWNLSNVRYGLQMLLPAGVFAAYLVGKFRYITLIVLFMVLIQTGYQISTNQVITYNDGTGGLSSQKVSKGPEAVPVEEWMNQNYTDGLVLMDDYRRPISPVNSGVPMNNFIGVGNKPYWQETLDSPPRHAQWIVMQKADTDAVWRGLKNKQMIDDYYINVFRSGNIWIYRKKSYDENFVRRRAQQLVAGNDIFTVKGVNIYDFIQFNQNEIDDVFGNLKKYGLNTVRIWGFNKKGFLNSDDYARLDYILNKGAENQIRIILVFGNQWDDYGGIRRFAGNPREFYSSRKSFEKFSRHISNILNHNNSINNRAYKDDPTILSWEILNEPRLENSGDSQIVQNWVEKTGQYIATIDNRHLISVGLEGFLGGDGKAPYHESHGANLQEICALAVIDMCSVHLYPKYLSAGWSSPELEELFTKWQTEADKLHKPIYIGEVGFDLAAVRNDQLHNRMIFFRDVFLVSQRKRFNGVLVWNVTMEHNDFYSLSFNYPADKYIFDLWKETAAAQDKVVNR